MDVPAERVDFNDHTVLYLMTQPFGVAKKTPLIFSIQEVNPGKTPSRCKMYLFAPRAQKNNLSVTVPMQLQE